MERFGGFLPAAIALTLPFVFIPTASDSYILPRASIVIAGACVGVGIALLLHGGPPLGALRWPLLAAAAAAVLAFITSVSWPLSLAGSYTRYESLPMRLSYLALLAAPGWLVRSPRQRAWLIAGFVLGTSIPCFKASLQWIVHAPLRPAGRHARLAPPHPEQRPTGAAPAPLGRRAAHGRRASAHGMGRGRDRPFLRAFPEPGLRQPGHIRPHPLRAAGCGRDAGGAWAGRAGLGLFRGVPHGLEGPVGAVRRGAQRGIGRLLRVGGVQLRLVPRDRNVLAPRGSPVVRGIALSPFRGAGRREEPGARRLATSARGDAGNGGNRVRRLPRPPRRLVPERSRRPVGQGRPTAGPVPLGARKHRRAAPSRCARRDRARLLRHAGRPRAAAGQPRQGAKRLSARARDRPLLHPGRSAPLGAGLATRLLRGTRRGGGRCVPPPGSPAAPTAALGSARSSAVRCRCRSP